MVKDAEANADADKKRRAAVEAKNQAESLLHSAEKSLEDYGDKVSEEDRAAISAAIEDLKAEVEKPEADAEAIKAKSDRLAEASMKLGQAMYEAAQAEQPEGEDGADASEAAKDDVVDADFEEVNDDAGQKKSA